SVSPHRRSPPLVLHCLLTLLPPPSPTLFPYTTLFRSIFDCDTIRNHGFTPATESGTLNVTLPSGALQSRPGGSGRSTPHLRDWRDRKSTRLNSSHVATSYSVFCCKKKNTTGRNRCSSA